MYIRTVRELPPFGPGEDVDQILWIGTEGDIARDGDAGIERRDAAIDVVGRHQRAVELGGAAGVDDLADFLEAGFDVGGDLGLDDSSG